MNLLLRVSNLIPVFLLLALPFSLGAGPGPEAEYTANRKSIESMGQPQRDRLNRNFNTYRELTGDQKDYYKNLHQEIEKDAIERPIKNLKESMSNYIDWLNTIDPYDRQKIREETDLNKRMNIVRQILMDDARKLREVKMAVAAFLVLKPRRGGTKFDQERQKGLRSMLFGKSLSDDDLNAFTKLLESEVPFNQKGMNDLAGLTGAHRKAYVFQQVLKVGSNETQSTVGIKIVDKLENTISDPQLKQAYFGRDLPDNIRRKAIGALLLRSIFLADISEQMNEEPIDELAISKLQKEINNEPMKRLQNLHPELISDPSVQKELLEWAYGVRKYNSTSIIADSRFLDDVLPYVSMPSRDRGPRGKMRAGQGGRPGGGPGKGPKGKGQNREDKP